MLILGIKICKTDSFISSLGLYFIAILFLLSFGSGFVVYCAENIISRFTELFGQMECIRAMFQKVMLTFFRSKDSSTFSPLI